MSRRIATFMAITIIGLTLLACNAPGNGPPQKIIPRPPEDEAEFKARFGQPDDIMVGASSRIVSYWRHGVEISYKRAGNSMIFNQFQDAKTKAEISWHEVLIRLNDRDSMKGGIDPEPK